MFLKLDLSIGELSLDFKVIEQYFGTTFNALLLQFISKILKLFKEKGCFICIDKIPFSAYIAGKSASGLKPIEGASS